MKTRVSQSSLSGGRIGKSEGVDLRDATLRMGRSVRGVPEVIANIWYGFTRSEPRNKRGHLLGAWPDVARAFAEAGASLGDVMSPVHEVERELKRDIYRRELPSLEQIEAMEAEVTCAIQKAEIGRDFPGLREAAHEEAVVAQLLEEAVDRAGAATQGGARSGLTW